MYHVFLLYVTFQGQYDVLSMDSMFTLPLHTHGVTEGDVKMCLLISSSSWDFMNIKL